MKARILTAAIGAAISLATAADAAEFYTIAGVTSDTAATDFYPASRLIQGSGVGFDAAEPHNALGTAAAFLWVTNAPNGGAGDYFNPTPTPGPRLVFDLGSPVPLNEISVWGYADTNKNGMTDMDLRFSLTTTFTGAPVSIGGITQPTAPRQSFSFPLVTAQYVELVPTDNLFGKPGTGAGGDRVGLGEVAFEKIAVVGAPDITVAGTAMPTLAYDVTTDFNITVSNTGDQNLIINGTNPTGANGAAFTVTNVVSPVVPQASEDITVQFDPTGLGGPIEATLQIMSNDPDTPTAEVVISANLPELGPDISAPATAPLTAGGAAETLTIPIDNLGRMQLDLSAHEIVGTDAGAFTVTGFPANIAALSSDNIQVSFDPTGLELGFVNATLRFTTNDPDAALVEIALTGGIPAAFYPIAGATSTTDATDLYAAANLIQGPGLGFGANWPHDALGLGQNFTWVTNAPNGGTGADYFNPLPAPAPAIVLDLGQNVPLAEVSFWGYADSNANGANLFSLRFATDADGPAGFGNTLTYNPTFAPLQDAIPRQSFAFDQTVSARYVEWTPLDNFFGINPPGGDRIGAGEIAFEIVPGAGVPFVIVDIVRNSPTSVSITFTSEQGVDYAIDRSTDLIDWSNELTDNEEGQQGMTTFTDDTVPADTREVFYRVRRL